MFPHINSHILCIHGQRDHRHRPQHTPAWRYLGLKSLSTASLLFCLWHPLHTRWDQINQLLIPCQALKQKLLTAPAPDVVRVPLLTPQSTLKHFSEPLQLPPCVLIPVFNSPFDASPGPANFAFQINLILSNSLCQQQCHLLHSVLSDSSSAVICFPSCSQRTKTQLSSWLTEPVTTVPCLRLYSCPHPTFPYFAVLQTLRPSLVHLSTLLTL